MNRKNLLAICIAGTMASLVTTSISQASDIDIYQEAKSGDITLMFLIDVSGSMGSQSGYEGTGKYRIDRVKEAMRDLLNGNTSKGTLPISDDKIIGLSTLGALKWSGYNYSSNNLGAIVVPARRLDAKVGSKTQRQILLEEVEKLTATTSTPTGWSYLETISYMLGNRGSNDGYDYYARSDTKGNTTNRLYKSPDSLTQSDDLKECSGQGIYVLTDGEPTSGNATESRSITATGYNSLDCNGNWNCIQESALAILDPQKNSKKLKFKTAVVGFGNSFNSVAKFDRNKTQEENLKPFVDATTGKKKSGLTAVQEAAYWGIIGEGGWYSGNKPEDVVESVNAFIDDLSTEIPSVTTGTPTIPVDELNPSIVQNYAYYPQFQPTPDKTYQLWLGNLKKYNVKDNGLRDKAGSKIVDSTGKLLDNYDLWSPAVSTNQAVKDADENTLGSNKFALMGGVRSQLLLKADQDSTKEVKRKLLTNRVVSGSGTAVQITQELALKPVELDYLTKTSYKDDPARGYLMNLLGYKINPIPSDTNKIDLTNLRAAAELRQIGAVMHSTPILLTNEGKITYDETTGKTGSSDRKDYLLFGTTQGLLHVVDAETGKEKFAFVPNEMVNNQKEAFTTPDATSKGLKSLYYGIDGPWTTYTEYVLNGSDDLTVKKGKNSQEGKQIVYGGLRMGGKSYYALDLADIDNPKMLFHIDPVNKLVYNEKNPKGKSFSALSNMGQSWSKPSIAWVRWGNERKRVMFVGGGYDAEGFDSAKTNQKSTDTYRGYEYDNYKQINGIGGGVYMFDADNGELLWWASSKASTTSSGTASLIENKIDSLKYSVVSQIRTVDRDSDGLTDHLYFGDLGGQVFRIDLNNLHDKDKKNQFMTRTTRILNLNKGENSPRFYEMPGFSIYDYAGQPFGVVSIGSGNRSMPLAEYTVSQTSYEYDAIYNIYDKDVARKDLYTSGITLLTPERTDAQNTNHLEQLDDTKRFVNPKTTLYAPYGKAGWYYPFKSNKVQSEKVLSTPIVIKSDMYVSTFDGSKPGLAGDCGAGVKGESFTTLFCMPYGQCDSGDKNSHKLSLGAGITGATIGANESGDSRVIVVNTDASKTGAGSAILNKEYTTTNSLKVQRWYEKLENIKQQNQS